jgi:hypothetical protein
MPQHPQRPPSGWVKNDVLRRWWCVQAAAGLCVDAYRETLHPRSQPLAKSTPVRRSLHQPMMLLIIDGELQLLSRGR